MTSVQSYPPDVDAYFFCGRGQIGNDAREEFAKVVSDQHDLVLHLFEQSVASVAKTLGCAFCLRFTNDGPDAEAAADAPDYFKIAISIKLLERIFVSLKTFTVSDSERRAIGNFALCIAFGHELAHAFGGHLEEDPAAHANDGRAQEFHADFAAGYSVAAWVNRAEVLTAEDDGQYTMATVLLSALLLFSLLDTKLDEQYHSAAIRFVAFMGGYSMWLLANRADGQPILDKVLFEYRGLVEAAVPDGKLRNGMLAIPSRMHSDNEDYAKTVDLEKRGQVHFSPWAGVFLGRPRGRTVAARWVSASICWRKRSLPQARCCWVC